MIGKFTSPVTELPFGALSSDWRRLLLLERAQPEGSILREKLGRLFRILAVAYFQTVEPSDITEPAIFSTTGSWDGSTSESVNKFEEDPEEAEKLGTPATDSTETNHISESFALTNPPGLEEASRVPEIGLTASDTTESYDERFDYSTNAIVSSSITIRSSTFHTTYKIQSLTDQNSIDKEKRLENMTDFNNSTSDKNDSSDDSVSNRVGAYTPKVISFAASGATKADGERLDSSTNPIDSSVITATSSTFDVNTIGSSTTQSLAGQDSIGEDKRFGNFKNINNQTFENYDELANNRIDEDSQQEDQLTTQQQMNTFSITSLPFYTTTTSTNTRSSEESSTGATIEGDRSLKNLKSTNNSVVGREDDLVDSLEINKLNTTASPFYTTTTSTNTRSSEESSTGATIERDRSMTNLNSINSSVVGKEDDLVDSVEVNTLNTTASPFYTTTSSPNTRSSEESSTTRAIIEEDGSFAKIDDLMDPRSTTQQHQEMNTYNTTASSPFDTMISTTAMSSEESSAARAIIEGDESWQNTKVVALNESDSVNKHQGGKMAAVGKETVGSAKDGSSDHFRGAEVATVAAEAAVGGFVAGKSSVAGAIVEKDAQPITSPVSESDTPVTPFGSDFSTSRIRDYGTMNVTPGAVGIKESGSVVPTRTEIARNRGDSPLVYTAMNSEDQENTAEYRGTPNTSDPEMTDVKIAIVQSRVHTDRIRGNEIPGDGSLGQQPVHRKDGGSSTHRSIQKVVPYRGKIREPPVSRKPEVDSEFSSRIVIPRIVASATGSPSNRPDPRKDNRSRTGPVRSKKRGSLNTDVEKSFRWFYNAEKDGGRGSDQRGIRIECSEDGHDHDNSVL
ncbi:uncharacterized protein LOC143210317 [Lasioglossum baleicum]|uniref:uncharacterized protein LOC143210317 n=1 Tax=Lasioglossum baleicum TaxID=434251 RepID=UPI003FCDFFCC